MHTPGPWQVGSLVEIRARNNYVVARLGDPVHMQNDTTAANARLIAAAPDMLEALHTIATYCASQRPVLTKAEMSEIARAAIAKATGGE